VSRTGIVENLELTGRMALKQTEFIYQTIEISWLFLQASALTPARSLLI
jgi:hypothetical protein